ncbi:DsbA family oxidoreductase [Salinimicrobium flavum]|uniref:DsbA family protein n=1 Tax=Salinimicrobium flavum TaxID=1737065 RepID=A0ABW5IZN8_9FLAO
MITIDIWSDVRCPFCYIGKRNFEDALAQFEYRKKTEVIWHSFQLDPKIRTRPGISALDYFVEEKNISREQAQEMFQNAQKMAVDAGLEMDLETSVVANSYRAHLLIQLAKSKGVANEIEEALFKAHFSEAKNIDEESVLLEVAASAGIESDEAAEALTSESLAYEVKQDEMQAQNIGVRGVPFFVFDNKYGVSGAQPAETFLEVLNKTWQESGK